MPSAPPAAAPDVVLVVDFGAQYAQLIARRVREARVYSEIVPSTMPVAEMLAKNPKAIILSGGPSSVYAEDAPSLDRSLFEAGVPVFGMCYGFQLMATTLGGTVDNTGAREYGRTPLTVSRPSSTLFEGTPAEQSVWMSHGDACSAAPEGFTVTASTDVVPVAAFENDEKKLYGVQYHPEVMHSTHGQQVLEHFLYRGAGIEPNWTTHSVVEEQVAAIRAQVGTKRAICGLSGGVDSAVAAALVQKAIGDQLTCVYVDHGLMRKGESEQVEKDFVAATGVQLKVVEAEERFLNALAGVSEPEQKRKIIGREFIRVFEQAQAELVAEAGAEGEEVAFLVQGTLYPDIVESGGGTGTANIKSHHNVGGLPDDIEFELVEPLRQLFKDEVRMVGTELGLPDEIVPPPAVPRPRPGYPDRRRGHQGAPGPAARGRRHRPRGADRGRSGPRDLAVPGGAARGRPQRRRPGRRPHVRPPDRAAPGLLRGRDDRGLDPDAVRRAGADLHPHHQRGRRCEPRRPRRHQQAAGHHRVGVIPPTA